MTDINRARSTAPTPAQGALDRGQFSDGVRSFTVRASGPTAPDSFQVFTNGNRAEVVLVVSGINTGELRATWGLEWRTASETWRDWFEANAFMVFYNGNRPTPGTASGTASARRVRICNG